MRNFKELFIYARSVVAQYPDLKEEVLGLIDLCESEIEEGGSVQHEIDLCKRDIDEIVEERTKDRV
jgi:hypothetical protein